MAVTWNPADKNAAIVLSNGNTTAARTGAESYAGVRGTVGYSTGTYYFEATVPGGSGAEGAVGLANATASISDPLGFGNNNGIGAYSDGAVWSGAGDTNLGSVGYHNRRLGFLVNLTTRRLWIRNDAGAWVVGGDPAASGAGHNISGLSGALFPMATLFYGDDSSTIYSEAGTIIQGLPAGATLWGESTGTPVTPPAPTRKPIRYGRWF